MGVTSLRYGWLVALPALWLGALGCSRQPAADVPVVRAAVAGNFAAPQAALAHEFRISTGYEVETSLGATGQLYAQIVNGAPFDVFLAADSERPQRLDSAGLTVTGTRFTYAVGRLVLYAPRWSPVRPADRELGARAIGRLAIANPLTAPYGAAARSALVRWGLWQQLEDRIVRAENVAQAFQFVQSGAADAGFVALAHVIERDARHRALVPDTLHPAIRQDAVLLRHGAENPAARAFVEFLKSETARTVISTFGYAKP